MSFLFTIYINFIIYPENFNFKYFYEVNVYILFW